MISTRIARYVAAISSTASELPAYLREALDVCLRRGLIPVTVENPSAGDRDAVPAVLRLIDVADVYIGFFGRTSGHIPPGYDKSIGELEYERALECGIPRLIFTTKVLPDKSIAVGPREEHEVARRAAFIELVKEKQVVSQVASPVEFRALLTNGLNGLRIRGETLRSGGVKAIGTRPKREVLRVFVASPKDVQDERSRMPKVIESLNRTLGQLLNVTIELWRWEVDAPPAVGEPQALVDVEMDQADVILVIFWNRFGTPTAAGTTGTEGEVLRSLERWSKTRRPQVMIYFCQRPASLGRAELEQRLKLLDFRERISSLVLAADYVEAQEFEWRVRDDLFTTITRLYVMPK